MGIRAFNKLTKSGIIEREAKIGGIYLEDRKVIHLELSGLQTPLLDNVDLDNLAFDGWDFEEGRVWNVTEQ